MAGTHYGNVFRNSAALMARLLDLHFPQGTIVDVNWGLGTFYKGLPREVVGLDLKNTGRIVGDNQRLPLAADSFDVGVCDPPYKRGDGVKYEARYGVAPHTEQRVTRLYELALPELLRVCRMGLILKVQDGTDGHRFYARHTWLVQQVKGLTGLEPHDIAVVIRDDLPSTMAQGVQHFFQQGVSYFLVYKWSGKRPFKPVRFVGSVQQAAHPDRLPRARLKTRLPGF